MYFEGADNLYMDEVRQYILHKMDEKRELINNMVHNPAWDLVSNGINPFI